MTEYSLFSYKKGNSFLHKCPAWVKILFIPAINILFLCLPPAFAIGLLLFQFVLAFCLHFTVREQLTDLMPIVYYAILLFVVQILTVVFSSFSLEAFKTAFSWNEQKGTVLLLVKLFAVMQSASLVFKTSTSLELRDGIGKIFGQKSLLTNAFFMFLNFIPMVGKIWNEVKRAWFARGGKHNVKMYVTLLPVLFSVGMKKAYNAARAVAVRKS